MASSLDRQNARIFATCLPQQAIPPEAPAAHEVLHGLRRALLMIIEWRAEPIWSSLHAGIEDQLALTDSCREAERSLLKPSSFHPMWGDFSNWPYYAALAAGRLIPDDRTWSTGAALCIWPEAAKVVLGATVPEVLPSHRDELFRWLRVAAERPDALEAMQRLIGGCSTPAQLLRHQPILANASDKRRWAALRATAQAFEGTSVRAAFNRAAGDASHGDPEELPEQLLTKAIDQAIAALPENEGVAPEDAGAVSYQSRNDEKSPATDDRLFLCQVRTQATARQFNHLSLSWDQLSPTECAIARARIREAFRDEQTRPAALAFALSPLLGLSWRSLPALKLHPDLGTAIASLAPRMQEDPEGKKEKPPAAALAWCGDQILAVLAVPQPECAYQPPESIRYAAHVDHLVVSLPREFTEAFPSTLGEHPQGHLIRFFPAMAEEATALAREIRQSSGARLTAGRLRRAISSGMYRRTLDECAAARALPLASPPTGAGLYYSAYRTIDLADLHRCAARDIVPWRCPRLPPEIVEQYAGTHVGSRLVIPLGDLQEAIQALHTRTHLQLRLKRATPEAVIAAHNAMTHYTVAVLCLVTGHRPTLAPFPLSADLDGPTGWVVIVDKRSDERTEQRIVPLPSVAREQIVAYRRSVAAVAGYLDRFDQDAAAKLRSILESEDKHASAALFSLLELAEGRINVRPYAPSDWRAAWPEWIWPLNGTRHALVQFLCSRGVRRESINYLMGHAEFGQTPFGKNCTVTPSDFQQDLTRHLDAYARTLQMAPLRPLRPYSSGVEKTPPLLLPAPAFGDFSRTRTSRSELSAGETEQYNRILQSPGVLDETDPEHKWQVIRALLREEFGAVEGSRIFRIVHREKELPSKQETTPWIKCSPDPTPVARDELAARSIAHELRHSFPDQLTTFLSSKGSSEPAEWLAWIYLGAVLFSGLLEVAFLSALCEAVPAKTYFDGSRAWIEWQHNYLPRRSVLDPLTALVVARFAQAQTTTASAAAVRHAIHRIAGELRPNLPRDRDERFKRLLASAGAWHRATIPGPMLAHLCGDRVSAVVPRSTLLRATGARLLPSSPTRQVVATAEQKVVGRNFDGDTFGSFSIGVRPRPLGADPIFSELRELLRDAQASSQSGGSSHGSRGERIAKLRGAVDRLQDGGHPVCAQMALAWVRQLVTHGGRQKETLAPSTIAKYVAPILQLVESGIGGRLLEADAAELEAAYRSLILSGPLGDARIRLACLQDFHEIATADFGVEAVDWTEITAELPPELRKVDANLVFLHEVELADRLLAEASDLPADIALMARCALALMYYAGLRFGAFYRLRVGDVQADCSYLLVRNTEHGEVKSAAGLRIVPLCAALPARSASLLKALIRRAQLLDADDPWIPLCCDERNPRSLISRADVSRALAWALRTATGDSSVRPHTLRHSCVTNWYDQFCIPTDAQMWTAGAALRSAVLQEPGVTRRAIHGCSQLIGHSDPEVTHLSYVHQQEFRAADLLTAQLPPISPRLLAALMQQPEWWVRKRLNRGFDEAKLLQSCASELLADAPDMHAWRGLEYTRDAFTGIVEFKSKLTPRQYGLLDIHRILDTEHGITLPDASAARLWGVAQFDLTRISDAAIRVTAEHGYAWGISAHEKAVMPWSGYGTSPRFARSVPPHMRALPCISQMDALAACDETLQAAGCVLQTFCINGTYWQVATDSAMRSVLDWLNRIGVRGTDIKLIVPSETDSIDPERLHLPISPHVVAQRTKEKRRKTREAARISVLHGKKESGVMTTITHATFLWLVRARAFGRVATSSGKDTT